MSIEDQELLAEFVIESQEHLSDVENQLLTLESQGDAMDIALVNTVFRAVHSIKGAAGFLGLEVLQGLAHREEEILNKLRSSELRPTSVVIDTLLKATDRLKGLLSDIDTSNDQDISEHLAALESILNGEEPQSQPAASAPSLKPKTSESNPPPTTPPPTTPHQTTASPTEDGLSDEALRDFLIEGHDNLEQLERDLISLEENPESETLINGVFRSIHTIKGTAGFLGFQKLEGLTHVAETLLGDVRSGQLSMAAEIAGSLLLTVDKIRELLTSIEETGAETECGSEGLADALTKLHQILLESIPKKPSKPIHAEGASAQKPAAKSAQPTEAKEALDNPVVAAADDALPSTPEPQVKVDVASNQSNENRGPEPTPVVPPATPNATAVKSSSATADASAADSTIRVDVSLLDKLMTCVGELVLARNQVLQFANVNVDSAFHRTSQRLNLITSELQESVMKTRMQPIGNVWSKFPRLVRDLASICKKQVRIEMEGKETELDKTIIEAIKDPLTHLVRNTVDHGIESADKRLQKGKPEEGCLTLRAYHEGGQVNIEICDDGGGINPDAIKAKALEKGLMTHDQLSKMSDRDVGNLIFLPGFSTAAKVSNVSGRGVGMDVVKTNIEKIGGTVDLQSEQGVGTIIKIKIPLTLAIIPALIVGCDNYRYAIPQVNLLELLRLDGDESESKIEWIQSAPVYRLRGRLLPLVYLRDELQLPKRDQIDALNIVVLRADDRQFGLVVDRINDSEEIVVKPLSSQLKNIPVYSGTTIMGDGQVALILDVMGLAQSSNVISDVGKGAKQEFHDSSQASKKNQHTLLVAGIGATNRVAVELAQVTRLEKIELTSIEIADGREVVQYRGEILPLIRLSDVLGIPCSQNPDDPFLNVVVYNENERTVGIVVDRIIDIVEQSIEHSQDARANGRLLSAVIQGQVTDLIDLPAIMSQC
jgi:two-component system chemotaxis sensor kinase CheA